MQLDEIVTTATGEQRKLEVGNAVATIDAARIAEESPITEFGNLLSGRAAGVQVQKSGGTTGTGTRIRIRGSNSVSLSNEPLYYVDGIRMESGASSATLDIGGFGQGAGAAPSRINDLNPEDIESIEIVKGPAAATLYGIQASNGVVRITTKQGRAGRARWNLYAEIGAVHDQNTYPINFNGRDSTQATGIDEGWDGFCTIQAELDGSCTQTAVTQFSPLDDPFTSPLKAGLRQQYGANVSGGTEQFTYYLSGDYENEDGVFRLPQFEEDSVREMRGTVPDYQLRPNTLERLNLRANLGANVSADADLQASIGYTSSDTRFVENDNSFETITGSGEASGSCRRTSIGAGTSSPPSSSPNRNTQSVERFIGGLTGNWRPLSWLTTRATLGYDVTNRQDVQFWPTGQVAELPGPTGRGRSTTTGSRSPRPRWTWRRAPDSSCHRTSASKTTVGGQFFRDFASGTFATGRGLPAGSETITGAGEHRGAGTPPSSPAPSGPTWRRSSPSRSGSSSPARCASTTTAPSARTSTPRSTPRPASPGCCPRSRSSDTRASSTPCASAPPSASAGQQPGTTDALRYLHAGLREARRARPPRASLSAAWATRT